MNFVSCPSATFVGEKCSREIKIPAEIEREIFHFEGVDYLDDDYTIKNVTIDRRTLTIAITDKAEEKTSNYSIDIKKYPFLRTLLPSDLVSIVRLLNTDEVSFQWILKGYVIPLKEFEIKEINELDC